MEWDGSCASLVADCHVLLLLKEGSTFISHPHSVPKAFAGSVGQNSSEFRDQEPSCGGFSQVIPVCRFRSITGVHLRCENKQKSVTSFPRVAQVLHAVHPALQTPLLAVQRCLLHWLSARGWQQNALLTTAGTRPPGDMQTLPTPPKPCGGLVTGRSLRFQLRGASVFLQRAEGCHQCHTRTSATSGCSVTTLCDNRGPAEP